MNWLLLILFFSVGTVSAQVSGFHYLNELRQQAGMQPFVINQYLQKSAQQHADYLAVNRQWGHSQLRGRPNYVAATPMERMLIAGYNNRHGSENVSSHLGSVSAKKSIDGLMGAIYHRFAFLSFDHDQAGIGYAAANNFHSYVYNMGNSQKELICSTEQNIATPGQYLYKVCKQQQQRIRKEIFDQAEQRVRMKNAGVVIWPYDKAEQISPAFYTESPDPLPDIDVSGYPVSVQFNPAHFSGKAPRVSRFELFRSSDNEKVELAAYFNKNSDVNHKFSIFEHAIFPLNRLQWDTEYRAEVDYLDARGLKQQITWSFRTTNFQLPRYELHGGETITTNGKPFVVYMSPLSRRDAIAQYTLSYQGFTGVNVAIFDPHTLIIEVEGAAGEASFDFHGRTFRVIRH